MTTEKVPMVIAVFNSKGGVGKTTLSRNLAHELGHEGLGLDVLCLDFDDQGNLTELFGAARGEGQDNFSLWDALEGREVDVQEDMGAYVFPGGSDTENMELLLQRNPEYGNRFAEFLSHYVQNADVTIIDLSPKATHIGLFGLTLATHVVVPSALTAFSIAGVRKVINSISGTDKRILAFVPMGISPDGASGREFEVQMRDEFSPFGTVSPQVEFSQYLKRAINDGKPLRAAFPGLTEQPGVVEQLAVFQNLAKLVAETGGLL